ncbi:hypothetical protein T459_22720 [Capsicum annuum]|uniref:Uncharacterized protein n=1 Tax=Capsicum annuum TaxID=4072 RepID=A0A2G2YQI5_CAPAN|nr:hypothetical protein T459_22720 [Capsicum annuum]
MECSYNLLASYLALCHISITCNKPELASTSWFFLLLILKSILTTGGDLCIWAFTFGLSCLDSSKYLWVRVDIAFLSVSSDNRFHFAKNTSKLFELLSLCAASAELSWPAILSKRHMFREVFQNFDSVAVSKLNEKKIAPPGSPAALFCQSTSEEKIIDNEKRDGGFGSEDLTREFDALGVMEEENEESSVQRVTRSPCHT